MSTLPQPDWTILIATIGQRRDRFKRLLDVLLPQLDRHDGKVTICAFYNNGERPLGHVRQDLVEHATSTYVSFIDDDDEVPEYFVDDVVTCLKDDVDYVGWQMQCYVDGRALKPTYHSVRYHHWWDDGRGFYRDISHLNPIRRRLAMLADFRRGDPPEDVSWATQLRGLVLTECYIDKVMYHYHASSTDSTWRQERRLTSRPQLEIDHPSFTYHPASGR